MNFTLYLISINIISFIICYIDKIKSIKHKFRISEKNLFLLSIAGGPYGMAIGMNIFHHKTKKIKFKLIYILCIVWAYIIYKISFTN